MRKLFLSVSMRVNGHVEVRIVRKPDLEDLRFVLRCDKVRLSHVQDGWPVAQQPFLAVRILQPIRRLEGSTHFGIMPESSTENKFLKEDFGRTRRNPAA